VARCNDVLWIATSRIHERHINMNLDPTAPPVRFDLNHDPADYDTPAAS
jgi:hypothetical protein